jgi:citrate synthase
MTGAESETKGAELHVDGKVLPLDIIKGTANERAVDIRKLRNQTGLITYDPGYVNTGACQSAITFVDGEKGILLHRGYSIEDLAANSTFLDVAYLLIYGEMPDEKVRAAFLAGITDNMLIPQDMVRALRDFPEGSHPMSILSAMMVSLTNFYPERADASEEEARLTVARLLGKVITIAAFSYKVSVGEPSVYPEGGRSYADNFLNMMFSSPVRPFDSDPDIVRAMDLIFMLHADHEQNCSTSTVRLVGSSGARLYAAVSAGICALWGPLHGGANQQVIEMLENIQQTGLTIDQVVDRAINDKSFRLFGFGHRVYKAYDPRAKIAKQACEDVLNKLGKSDALLDIAVELEQAALANEYFKKRNLYPNVDFYTGITLRALGLPTSMFTVIFAIGRMPGWIAHWLDLMNDPERKIGRPRQIYTGSSQRTFS